MCSIRNACVLTLMLVALAMSAAGCQPVSKHYPPAPVNNTPLVVDEAMQIRDWDRSTSHYANGATVAGGTAYCWETADWVKPGHRRFVDGPVATLNIVSTPVGLFVNSPFEKQVIHGEIVPPTYTGQPPLPGAPPSSPQANVTETTETIPPPAMETPPAPGEPGEPPVAPPAVETPPPPIETAPPPAPAPAPETTSPPAPAPAPSDTPTPPSTVEPAPAAPGTAEPPAPSSTPAPTPEPLNK